MKFCFVYPMLTLSEVGMTSPMEPVAFTVSTRRSVTRSSRCSRTCWSARIWRGSRACLSGPATRMATSASGQARLAGEQYGSGRGNDHEIWRTGRSSSPSTTSTWSRTVAIGYFARYSRVYRVVRVHPDSTPLHRDVDLTAMLTSALMPRARLGEGKRDA